MTDRQIIRSWTALCRRGDVDTWIATFRNRVLPHMREIDGFQGVNILCAVDGDPCKATVLTRWRDMASLYAFAGDQPEKAVIPDFMEPFFVEYDSTATFHEDIFQETAA